MKKVQKVLAKIENGVKIIEPPIQAEMISCTMQLGGISKTGIVKLDSEKEDSEPIIVEGQDVMPMVKQGSNFTACPNGGWMVAVTIQEEGCERIQMVKCEWDSDIEVFRTTEAVYPNGAVKYEGAKSYPNALKEINKEDPERFPVQNSIQNPALVPKLWSKHAQGKIQDEIDANNEKWLESLKDEPNVKVVSNQKEFTDEERKQHEQDILNRIRRIGLPVVSEFREVFKALEEGKAVKVKVTEEQSKKLQNELFANGHEYEVDDRKVRSGVKALCIEGKNPTYWSDISDGSSFPDFSKDEATEVVL